MKKKRRRSDDARWVPHDLLQATTRVELTRFAKLARWYLPRGMDRLDGRRMTNARVVVETVFLVGSAAGKLFGLYSPACFATLGCAVAPEKGERFIAAWRKIERLSRRRRYRVRRELRRRLAEEPAATEPRPVQRKHRARRPRRVASGASNPCSRSPRSGARGPAHRR